MPRSLNILHMCLSKGFGGLEMYPIRVGSVMLTKGHNVFGLSQEGTPVHAQMQSVFNKNYTLQSRGDGYRHLLRLAKWIKSQQIQYVHCHKSSDLMLAVLLKKLCDFKLIYTDHMGAKRPKKDIIHRFIYRNVDLVLSISYFTRARNIKALPIIENKVKTLWLGTQMHQSDEVESEPLDLKRQFSLSSDAILMGIVGRLSNGKGHPELLKALAKLKSKPIYLIIVGGLTAETGGDADYLKTLQAYIAEQELTDKVIFYGFSDDPNSLLKAIDIVVIPSHNEAFGLTVIEAMAAGKAIIGSSYGAIPEILESSGRLVDPFDTSAFVEVIQQLSNDPAERFRLSVLAQSRAREYFDQEKHVDALLTLYRET
ncbi:glycosyltransferase family 4 protein [Marinomonas algarum]|uniref:Glycosyltransferase family 4 protein n=1 Tax=Marinomonas algarum TaxID=2883105 RepID=A0A9X1IN88_9GAMM|nr:glycosyltransferase family 4 protein [Marinomonas algarum]MCB5160868.1 glycosyltransferase family 4 protein [Marinomonas algarum]